MKNITKYIAGALIIILAAFFAQQHVASAHEVYVLTNGQISSAESIPAFDMFDVAKDNLGEFTFWAFITIFTIFCIFFISIIRKLEKWLHPFFVKARKHAPLVARVTVGISFLAAAYYQASYGPELPLAATYGFLTPAVTSVLITIGLMVIVGFYARAAALIALAMYTVAVWFHGLYMLTYINYLGEIIVLLLIGAHGTSLDAYLAKKRGRKPHQSLFMKELTAKVAPMSFAILRICFGISLIFASAYAKVIYNNLGLFTVVKYHLDTLLGFEPHFLVLGAAIIEIVIGTFIVFGFELRFASLFFEFWLMVSLYFFGEVVWPHIILIGIPIALIMYGYDEYSLEGFLLRKNKYEPVL